MSLGRYSKGSRNPWIQKIEELVEKMQHTEQGVPLKTVQSLMTKLPSVFVGIDLIAWVQQHLKTTDQLEGHHMCHMLASYGYIYPVDDNILTVKNDGTLYRFQAKTYWISKCHEPDNTDYAIFLCKRSLANKSRGDLADYEAENLARLQKMFARKWDYVFVQAESQAKADKKKDKTERKVLESQERAFWALHRPPPGVISATEADIKQIVRSEVKSRPYSVRGCPDFKGSPKEALTSVVEYLNTQMERRRQKVSKSIEGIKLFSEMYEEFDPMIVQPEHGNPWVAESTDFWDADSSNTCVPRRRYKRWGFSILDLLNDPAGQEEFHRFLQKEFSAENIGFWNACRELKSLPARLVKTRVAEIYVEYLVDGSKSGINVDSNVAETVRQSIVSQPNRYSFDTAEEHIFSLMKNDSYSRFLRSEQHKEYVNNMVKKTIRNTGSKLSLFTGKNIIMQLSSQ